ncbi:TonB-dependent receptor domain-containing protein [Paucibacter soli]|uniref:TonB-dependent receptor domain-containing protein n=1 Tax=Paucibacter soli TaxID=3133433 RepID=UPI0030B76F11
MFKRKTINVAALLALGVGFPIAAIAQDTQKLERIEITGSAIKRLDAEGSLPVTTVTREQIARSGAVNTEELLNSVAAVSSIGGITNATGAGSSTAGRSTVSLRGLSGGRTLVLVNGRRLAPAAGGAGGSVNVNNIPMAAIDRIEVLKDGASSIYGSEALAGVINFILAKDFNGVDIGVSGGMPTRDGGGKTKKATLVGGIGNVLNDRFNLTASFSAESEDALFAKDREFAKTGNVAPYIVAGATGQGNIEGAYTPGTLVNGVWKEGSRQAGFGGSPGAGYGNPLAATGKCGDINMFKNLTNTAKGTPYCTFDSNAFVGLIPERKTSNLTLNGVFRASDALEVFGDVLFSRNEQTQRFQPSPVRRSFLTSDAEFKKQGVDPALLLLPSNPNYQIAANYLNANGFGALVGQPLAITARVFDFGPRTSKDITEQSRFVVGGRGEVMGQNYEVAYSDSKYELSGTVPDGYFSQVAYAKAIRNSTDWNPWSLTQSAAFQSAIAPAKYTGATLDGTTKSKVLDAKMSGEVFNLPAGAVAYAVGLQHREESYQTRPSAALFSGDIAGLGGAQEPVDKDRKIDSVFAEVIVPVLKTLEGGVAVRRDRYNDVGPANTYKANLRWQPSKQVVVRGGVGTGFRAPTLVELWIPQTVGTSAQFTDPKFPNNPNLQVNELSGGNPDLAPEKSKQYSLGVVFQPVDEISIGADLWQLKVNGIITAPSTQEIVSRYRAGDPAYANLVTLSPTGDVDLTKAINANVGSAKLSGLDVDVTGRFKVPGGRLDATLNGTYMIKYDQTSPGGSISRKVGTMVEPNGDPVLEADGGGVVLRWKHKLSVTYTTGAWSITGAQNYYTGYRTGDRQVDGEQNFVPAQAIYDMNLSYSGFKGLRLAAGVKNVFDKNPPIYVPVSNQFQAGYDISLYDPRSRFVYVSANYKF